MTLGFWSNPREGPVESGDLVGVVPTTLRPNVDKCIQEILILKHYSGDGILCPEDTPYGDTVISLTCTQIFIFRVHEKVRGDTTPTL